MKDKINELNNLYIPVLEKIEQVRECLGSHSIDHALVFLNNHHIKIDNEVECIKYPIPTIICKLNGIQTKIGLDLATDKDYIGFIKFTLSKEELLSFNFDALRSFRIEIYGFYYFQELVGFEDLEQIKQNAINSKELVLYIKTRISSITQIENIIDEMAKQKETRPQKTFSMSSYTCDCEHDITVKTYYGQCPICRKDSLRKRKFETTCSICKEPCLQDQFGDGECNHCGWKFSADEEKFEKMMGISYPMLVPPSRAREQYKQGKPFKASFEDFINGLKFYSEMLFEFNGDVFEVFFKQDKVYFCTEKFQQIYADVEEFKNKANIDGVLLKDMWDKIEKPSFMYCG